MPNERKGLSLSAANKLLKIFTGKINAEAPWSCMTPNWMMSRSPWAIIKLYMRGCGTNLISVGSNPYHEEAFSEEDVYVVDSDSTDSDADIMLGYDVPDHARCVFPKLPLKVVPSLDEAINVKATSDNSKAWFILWLRILCHCVGMRQSPHSQMAVMYADKHTTYWDEALVVARVQSIRQELGAGGSQSYYSEKYDFYVCYDVIIDESADWMGMTKWWQRTLGPNSKYPNPEILRIDENGNMSNVENTNAAHYEATFGTHVPLFQIDHISEAHIPGQVTFTSTPSEMGQYLAAGVEKTLNDEIAEAYENGTHGKYTGDYMHERRKSIAKSMGHAFCYLTAPLNYVHHFDPNHFQWSWIMVELVIFVVLMYSVWGWPKESILLVLSYLHCLYILYQFEDWMDKNPSRRMTQLPQVRSRGDTACKILNNMPYAIVCAMHVAEWTEEEFEDDIDVILVILSILYFTFVIMKEIFGILFKTKYYLFTADGRAVLVDLMIKKNKQVIYVVYNLATVLVEYMFVC